MGVWGHVYKLAAPGLGPGRHARRARPRAPPPRTRAPSRPTFPPAQSTHSAPPSPPFRPHTPALLTRAPPSRVPTPPPGPPPRSRAPTPRGARREPTEEEGRKAGENLSGLARSPRRRRVRARP